MIMKEWEAISWLFKNILDKESGEVISTHVQIRLNQNFKSSEANVIAFAIEVICKSNG